MLYLSAMTHIGLCAYINVMVIDLKDTIEKLNTGHSKSSKQVDPKNRSRKTETWLTYVEAINFHNNILK